MCDSYPEAFEVQSKSHVYSVRFQNISFELVFDGSAVVIDRNLQLYDELKQREYSRVIPIDANESSKDLGACMGILDTLADFQLSKSDRIYAVGGGVVQDLSTLSASLFKRGVNWSFFPTTLMSMMDSCIGGKSSINLKSHKNLIGNFFPPNEIVIDSKFALTLSSVDVSNGISEGIKITYARGGENLDFFYESVENWRKTGNQSHLNSAIASSLKCKKWFIEIDEYDKKERKLLNFGHTFGHAIESASNYRIPHGIGVLIGMKAAIFESGNSRYCSDLLKIIDQELDYSKFDFSNITISKENFLTAITMDKKNFNNTQVLILPNESGNLEIYHRPLTQMNLLSCWDSVSRALFEGGYVK
jgi:3-dehydroquinate synthase